MARWLEDIPDSRLLLVWLIVAAAFEFALQAIFAYRAGEIFGGLGWTLVAGAISMLAFFIGSIKIVVNE